jgi:hypothetical protein
VAFSSLMSTSVSSIPAESLLWKWRTVPGFKMIGASQW